MKQLELHIIIVAHENLENLGSRLVELRAALALAPLCTVIGRAPSGFGSSSSMHCNEESFFSMLPKMN